MDLTKATPEHWPPPIGAKLRTGFGNSCDELLHVRGYVDDQIVMRVWFKHKRRWSYRVETQIWWDVFFCGSQGTIET